MSLYNISAQSSWLVLELYCDVGWISDGRILIYILLLQYETTFHYILKILLLRFYIVAPTHLSGYLCETITTNNDQYGTMGFWYS
jgi:hypothetical protein